MNFKNCDRKQRFGKFCGGTISINSQKSVLKCENFDLCFLASPSQINMTPSAYIPIHTTQCLTGRPFRCPTYNRVRHNWNFLTSAVLIANLTG